MTINNGFNPLFPNESYQTPPDFPEAIGNRLLLRSRWWFYFQVFSIIFRSRALAKRNLYDNSRWIYASYHVLHNLERAGCRFQIEGLNNLKAITPPIVFISNHMSTLETFVFPCLIVPFFPVTFVVKETLIKNRFFRHIMLSRQPIVVSRNDSRRDLLTVIEEGQKRLAGGLSVVIFPQTTASTRQPDFRPEYLNSLGVKLAQKAGVNIVPIAIKTDCWGLGKIFRDFGPLNRKKRIHIKFGPELKINNNSRQLQESVVNFIATNFALWKEMEHLNN